ncbi:hypothetical protein IF1G_01843 [Cordyceps javanica]|uniref:Uncharacterized protein n=1 Tax=Cordyceps javanica TaxID=43265 RepID=A0A545VD29_9HYPO|nr:hypothetical protein IF1G_01843 [Cordyceps javanica]TQW10697.1 hypothetical protein IF2G_01639 [Cordyceps javanica]
MSWGQKNFRIYKPVNVLLHLATLSAGQRKKAAGLGLGESHRVISDESAHLALPELNVFATNLIL